MIPRGVFVTGSDTEVGKTVLAAALCAALNGRGIDVRASKPVLTGLDEPGPHDHDLLSACTGQDPEVVAPLRFGPAVSPHLAAEQAGTPIDPDALLAGVATALDGGEVGVVEGVGGLRTPLADDIEIRGLARALGLPVVIVARTGLGTINHSVLTVESARAAGLDVRAVVLTPWPDEPGGLQRSNRETIAERAGVRVLTLPHVALEPAALARAGADLPLDDLLGPPPRVLHGASVTLRPLRPGDVAALRAVHRHPDVVRWWNEPGAGWPLDDDDAVPFVIEHDGTRAGYIQFGEDADPDYRHAWIDVFVDPAAHGRGLGRDAVRTLADHLLTDAGFHRVIIDPAADNLAAVRAYRAAGFTDVGVLHRSQRIHDGLWHDTHLLQRLA